MADETQQPTDAEQLASDFKKDELQTAAAVQGVDVPDGAKKVEIAEAIVAQQGLNKVVLNQFTKRSDDDALPGAWVDVVSGEHEGRRGAYFSDVSHGSDGYPDRVLVRTRDADNLVVEVGYDEIRPSDYSGGR